MSRKAQMIIVIAVCAAVWIAGVYYLYNSYKTGDVGVSGSVVAVTREVDVDPKTGEVSELNFVEAKSGELALLTLACGVPALIFVVRAQEKG